MAAGGAHGRVDTTIFGSEESHREQTLRDEEVLGPRGARRGSCCASARAEAGHARAL